MSELNLEKLQESIHTLCQTVKTLKQTNDALKTALEGSENVRRLLVLKNKNLADQVKQIIEDLKERS
jgi:hypothetical protein